MANVEPIKPEDWKWKVREAASTLIEVGQVKKRMKADQKFKKAVKAELAKRLAETESAVAATKEAANKT